ncbi:MAG TPA: hypothetical protein VN280_06870, partial [Variovorax sp.]|nr:hypothetical protein [Variovorax sp.]
SLVADDLRGGALVDAGAGGWRVPVDIRLYRQLAHMAPVAEALWELVSGSQALREASRSP